MSQSKIDANAIASLFPDFSNLTEIGAGGFKTVFRGECNGGREVIKAIKLPRTDGSPEQDRFLEECYSRVTREINILRKCQTPFLVKLTSDQLLQCEIDGDHYAIYREEYLEGCDLYHLIKASNRMPAELEVKRLMNCLLLAIQELWSLRYVHRDIKPANVIKLPNIARPFVLIDLGIAFGLMETGITMQGIPCTARYLAPEMANPHFRNSLDYRADLYTMALTVFEYATGRHPIANDSDDAIRTISRALRQPPKKLKEQRPDFSEEFCALVDQLMKKKPALRPSNLQSLLMKTDV